MVCFHGRWGPKIGEVTCGGSPHLIEKRDYMDMRVAGYHTYLGSPTSM